MIAILVAIKFALKDSRTFKPQTIEAIYPQESIKPFSFQDYVTGVISPRKCVKKPSYLSNGRRRDFLFQKYSIEGINPYEWANPFLKCDLKNCTELGQNVKDTGCSINVLALAPAKDSDKQRVQDFEDYIHEMYPQIPDYEEFGMDHSMIKIFDEPSQIDAYVKDTSYGGDEYPKIAVAVILNITDDEDGNTNFAYKLRTNSTNFNSPDLAARPVMATQPNTKKKFDSFAKKARGVCSTQGGTSHIGKYEKYCTGQYMYNGALTIQRLVHDWIIFETGGKETGSYVAENGVSFVDFPSGEYIRDGFYAQIAAYAPLLFVLGLLYPVAAVIRFVVAEKEMRQKELMKMMSISESAIELSWFLSSYIFFFVAGIFSTICSCLLYPKASWLAMFFFWELGYLGVVLFALTVSTFFTKTSRATLVGVLSFFAGYFLTLSAPYDTGNPAIIRLVSLHPVSAITYATQMIGTLEDAQIGLNSNTFGFTDNPSGLTFRSALGSIIFDIFFWGFFMWYFNRVVPGEYGTSKPWYFPVQKSYWFRNRESSGQIENLENEQGNNSIPNEPVGGTLKEQENQNMGVHIRGMTKQFGDKTAVNELSLSMYSGQVFALLGHNGAGKTTTISMLTGMLAPTSGNAFINGKSIRNNMEEIREDVGICLQHDCLFPLLTVKEHLQFFAAVKGLYENNSKEAAEASIETSISDVALSEKSNTFSKDLSGGMKRKLSLAIAFCGGSKVIFLDEPTSGMDPFSRRFTWNVIRQNRQDRCICLTTHFMEEADLLGDRIAIMAEGGLCCIGSSLFLKKEYGVGYQITVEKGNDSPSVSKDISNIVRDAIPKAQILSDVSSEMTFQLPLSASHCFAPMFEGLDKKVLDQSIAMYGVGITTLDEVFLMVARGETGKHVRLASSRKIAALESEALEISGLDQSESETLPMISGIPPPNTSYRSEEGLGETDHFKTHVRSLFAKRALNFKRDKKAWACSTICPVIAALFGFINVAFIAPDRNMINLELRLSDYNENVNNKAERHLFPFNEADSFACQPAVCLAETEGTDYEPYCGNFFDFSNSSLQCSATSMSFLVDDLEASSFLPLSYDVSSVKEVSDSLLNVAKEFEASKYGALYFAHTLGSKLINGTTYKETVESLCQTFVNSSKYTMNCSNYAGIGYVVGTNFTAPHASLLYQAIADEMIIRDAVEEKYSISPSIHPLPLTKMEDDFSQAEDAFSAWFYLVLSFPFIAGSFVTFIVAERESKAKHLQTVAGVKPSAYWLSTFAWDVMNFQLPLWIIVIMIYAFGITSFTTSDRGVNVGSILLLFFYGPAAAGFAYICSFMFKSPSSANLFVIVFNFFIGLAGPLVTLILRFIYYATVANGEKSNLKLVAQIIEWILRLVPSFNFAKGLLYTINVEIFAIAAFDPEMTVWSSDIMGIEFAYLVVQSVLYVILAMYLDIWSTRPSVGRFFMRKRVDPSATNPDNDEVDEDVLEEANRVIRGEANSDIIVLSELKKQYGNGKIAVNGMTLGIPAGQCFGLLGINGAGKTTTMSMLTAEFPPTSGDASLASFSVTNNPEETRRRIGYCPQFDAHFMNMTGREHVELYASIKGIPKDLITAAARSKLAEVGLNEYDSDRLSSQYSGGMKRKLSVACATIGNPQIVFLDEPSTGMDPVARRDMWEVISKMVEGDGSDESKTSVILTTHVMEECEALCPRIGIMAGGKLRCLGSAQHLKSRFGKGYQVELKVNEPTEDDEDLKVIMGKLLAISGESRERGDTESGNNADDIHFTLSEAISAAQKISSDKRISEMINEHDTYGYLIHKNANSTVGVTLDELSAFFATEMRLQKLHKFFDQEFENSVLRERQDTRLRFEVPSEGTMISFLFASVEQNKEDLNLQDYGISQTTLEQVFNMHAASAEQRKQGTID